MRDSCLRFLSESLPSNLHASSKFGRYATSQRHDALSLTLFSKPHAPKIRVLLLRLWTLGISTRFEHREVS